jgi:glucuronate isomerase
MSESQSLQSRLLHEIMQIRAIDVHSHIPAAAPFARSLRELLGYHYYTELAHSAGTARALLSAETPDEEMIPALLQAMAAFDNTAQYGWLMELARELFGFEEGRLTPRNWQALAEAVREHARRPQRAREVMAHSHIEKVHLTNSFDEDLAAVDRSLFVPSLRADALVFGLHEPAVPKALERVTGSSVTDGKSLKQALEAVAERFQRAGARSVAISLPPEFRSFAVEDADFQRAVADALRGAEPDPLQARVAQSGALFALAGACRDLGLPLQVMYGALRDAYAHGVPQGADLPQAGDALRGLLPLLNAFPEVTFCLSVLSDTQAQELASYGWIFRNVIVSGHWWYANVPSYIARDLTARLQSVPKTKLIGYYSDMYKLEFGLAKFNMYRRILAKVLSAEFVEPGLCTEEHAVETAELLLRGNAIRIFGL